jgi:oligosaccharyltransferase complex subunit beta
MPGKSREFNIYFSIKNGFCSCRSVKSGNEDLALAVTDWIFKQRGVLRARNIRHYLKSDKTTPSFYTIKNDIVSRKDRSRSKR